MEIHDVTIHIKIKKIVSRWKCSQISSWNIVYLKCIHCATIWELSIKFWHLHFISSLRSIGLLHSINLRKFDHCISIALNVNNIIAHPICWIKAGNLTQNLLQYALVPLLIVPIHINLFENHNYEILPWFFCNSFIFLSGLVISFFTKMTKESCAQCLIMILSKNYSKCWCLRNLFSWYLIRCFAYSWTWKFFLVG